MSALVQCLLTDQGWHPALTPYPTLLEHEHTIQDDASNEGEGLALREYWNVVLKRIWSIVLVFILVVTGAALWTFNQPKIYEANATVIIDYQAPRVLNEVESAAQSSAALWYQDQVFETELRVLRSRHVAERVVDELGLAENLEFLGLDQLQNEDDLARALENSDPAARLLGLLEVEPVKETRVVNITIQHQDPELAAWIANGVAEAYRDQNLEHRLQAMEDAFVWLESQFTDHEARLQESGAALNTFKEQNPLLFTNPAEQQQLTNRQLEDLNSKLILAQDERRRVGNILKQLGRFKDGYEDGSGIMSLIENNELNELLKQRIALQSREITLVQDELWGPNSPKVKAIRQELELVDGAIENRIQGIRKGISGRHKALLKTEAQLQAQIAEVQAVALKLDELRLLYEQVENQKVEQQRLFELVQRRMNEVNLTKLLETNNIRILDRALPPTIPSKPRTSFNLLIAAILGLFGGVGLAFLLEFLDNTIKSQEDIEQQLRMPFLGVVPIIRKSDKRGQARELTTDLEYSADLHTHFFPKSSMAECTRTIRTNILFMAPDQQAQILVITSPSPLEGKTTAAISLGIVMSQSNSRVLMIGADMRRPRLYKSFGIEVDRGLSSVLVGKLELDKAIVSTGIERLDILPCGSVPPNPSELLSSQAFVDLLEQLRERYDRIIIDSPPVIAVTDAMVLAQHADGVVVVCRASSTRKELLKRTRQLLYGINAPVLGVILNGLNLENRRYGGTYYYYYRRYGQYYEDPEAKTMP